MCITKTGRRLDIQTDSRYRFERKVDSNNVENVLKIAAAIINDICGGQNGQIIFAKADGIAQAKVIRTSAAFINKRLGFEIDQGKVSSILLSLGFRVKIEAGVIEVTVPSWRHDISIQEDLVEEVIRVYGYDKIPAVPFPGYEITSVIPKEDKRKFDVKRVMASAGYDEVVTWSFMDHKLANTFGEVNEDLVLKNPISSDLGVMRQTIMPNLLSIIAKNNARSINDLSLFEVGPIFKGIEPEDESCYLAAVKSGVSNPNNCHDSSRLVDIFDIKADLDLVLRNIGLSVEKCQISFNIPAYYHPMRSAALSLGKNVIAYFGQIHPSLLKEVGIEQDVIAFELNLDSVPFSKPKFGRKEEFTASPFQPSERDYAFVMDEKQLAGEMVSCIKNIDKKLIRSVEIFDIYKGEKLDQGQKSVALRVKIQSDDKTLTEEELSAVSSKIISSLEQRFSAKLRS
jgi:phenylalanyl-tRNA synthetase beta chain